ncbi:QacE family quaternary ammonium compound efflux SMR transporter [Ignatzschineria ureiclastica]|uniref:Guanidinium exporter n=2 Tax=Ignatzschineria TaxID=112008 RepID=A0A2U2AG33_9GAMM|nr:MULTISPECIES: SMR family transporter [Ignatzschineria]PWD81539.1 QacE family quaternary ammonium compound efflux SMR transporter [Ignatzschineria ureiclastica]GHA01485.1 QacE family quaternary ammonium compound efflux SMR transporter [Ignatzschineria ureiclastica]
MGLSVAFIGWSFVALAAVAEMFGVFGLSVYSQRRSLINGLFYYGGIFASFALLYYSFHYLPMSIAYTVFTGIGTAGAVILNIVLFNESKNIKRILSLVAIIIGVVGLKYVSSH